MQKLFNIANIYIALWCLYFLQGMLYTEGGIVSQSVLMILLLSSLAFFVYSNFAYRLPIVLRVLDVLVLLFTIYGVIYMVDGDANIIGVASFSYLKAIYMSLLPIYSFYTFTRESWLTENNLKYWAILFLVVAIMSFFYNQQKLIEDAIERGIDIDGVTNNVGYILVALLPLSVLYRKKPVVQYVYIAICLGFTLFGMKRGAILIGLVCLLWLLYNSFRGISFKQKMGILILTTVLLVAMTYGVSYLMESSDYFAYRIAQTEDRGSSGRDILYRNAVEYLLNLSDTRTLFWGAGANSTYYLLGNYAHNDWLEIMINNGIVVALAYLLYWISLLWECFKNRKNTLVYLVLTSFFIIGFLETLFSMSYNCVPVYLSAIAGFVLALPLTNSHKKRRIVVIKKRV